MFCSCLQSLCWEFAISLSRTLENADAISAALYRALDPKFRHVVSRAPAAYGKAGASRQICKVLETVDLNGILYKRFFDTPEASESPI